MGEWTWPRGEGGGTFRGRNILLATTPDSVLICQIGLNQWIEPDWTLFYLYKLNIIISLSVNVLFCKR